MKANNAEEVTAATSDEVDEVGSETAPVKVERHLHAKEMVRYSDVSQNTGSQPAK